MTVNVETPRHAVEYRPRGSKRWQTVVTVGSAAIASQTMMDLMDTRSGDWAIRQLPCVDSGRPGASDSRAEPRGR